MWWRAGLVALVVVLAASAGAAAGAPPGPGPGPGTPVASGSAVAATNHTPADPETDVLGWEDGYWHNESIDVDQSDGLNASERNATVARSKARVELIRGLEFEGPVPVEIESRSAYRERRANETTPPTLRRFDNAKFEALFLVGEDQDSIAVQQENAGTAVLGFYSPRRGAIVLIADDADALQVEELTLAHELTHALQDQHFNLSRFDARTRDLANAHSGLIEGDASLVEFRYRQRCLEGGPWNGTCLSPSTSSSGGGGLANIGTYLVKFQPYSDGPRFITSLYAAGGWEAVNAAYEAPPESTEQVIHPERYRVDSPTNVSLDDTNTTAWERVRPDGRPDYAVLGESSLTVMIVFPLYDRSAPSNLDPAAWLVPPDEFLNRSGGQLSRFDPLRYENRFVDGWDGDRLHVYANEANDTAYVWRLVWDSPADAEEFVEAYREVLRYWGGSRVGPGVWVVEDSAFADAFAIEVEGVTVTIVNAPTVADLPEVRAGAGEQPSPTVSPASPSGTTALPPTPDSTPFATVTPGQPGFGPAVGLLAVLVAVWWRRRP